MDNLQTYSPPRVTKPVLIGVIWGATAISFFFITTRIASRVFAFRRLWFDDALAIGAWLMLLAQAIAWQIQVDNLYFRYLLAEGQISPTTDNLNRFSTLLRGELVVNILFYSSLWVIKASFLVFFRRLSGISRRWIIWFWCVAAFVAATYVVCIGNIPYRCLLKDARLVIANCSDPDFYYYQYLVMIINMVFDVLTDICIISLPVSLLWNAQIPTRRKIILMAILSLTVVIIIVSIVRVAVVATRTEQIDPTWLWMWSFIEATVANIIACVASFRQLFVKQGRADRSTTPVPRSGAGPGASRHNKRSPSSSEHRFPLYEGELGPYRSPTTRSQDSQSVALSSFENHRGHSPGVPASRL